MKEVFVSINLHTGIVVNIESLGFATSYMKRFPLITIFLPPFESALIV